MQLFVQPTTAGVEKNAPDACYLERSTDVLNGVGTILRVCFRPLLKLYKFVGRGILICLALIVEFFRCYRTKADNIVSMDSMDFGDFFSQTGQELGHEIVGVNFTWDTTTQVLSGSACLFNCSSRCLDVVASPCCLVSDGSLWVLDMVQVAASINWIFLTTTCFRCRPFPEHTLRISVSSATACPAAASELGTATVSAIPTPEPAALFCC